VFPCCCSASPGLGDLLEMERRLQAAIAERERLLRERVSLEHRATEHTLH